MKTGKTRAASFKPIKLQLDSEGEHLQIKCLGEEVSENAKITSAIDSLLIFWEKGFKEISAHIEAQGVSIGEKSLREFLNSNRYTSRKVGRGKQLFRFAVSQPLRECETAKLTPTEGETGMVS